MYASKKYNIHFIALFLKYSRMYVTPNFNNHDPLFYQNKTPSMTGNRVLIAVDTNTTLVYPPRLP